MSGPHPYGDVRPDPEKVAFDFGDSGDGGLDFGEESVREDEEVEEAGHWWRVSCDDIGVGRADVIRTDRAAPSCSRCGRDDPVDEPEPEGVA